MFAITNSPTEWPAPSVNPTSPALAYCRRHKARFLTELKTFIRFPSVSAQSEHADDLKRCAAWLADHLRRIGLTHVTIIPTRRHPVVYAEWCHAPGRPTVLVYGHYDVQPVDPLNEWRSPPFEPILRGNDLYGRGASDDKGQLFAHVKALEALLQTGGELPVNVKCLFEGEEEIGSPNLPTFLGRHQDRLGADVAVLSDVPMLAPTRPAITESMRGMLSLELEIRGADRDLHSGLYGGAIPSPLQILCETIASLHDHEGGVRIAGFYDRVRDRSPRERAYMGVYGPSDAEILHSAGSEQGWGEPGYTLYERTTIRPALTITGIRGGYQGAGPKAVIPERAMAKLDFRLVPDQKPEEIERLFRRHVESFTPATVRPFVRKQSSAKPAEVDRRHPAMRAAFSAYRSGFRAMPVFLRSGGTIPVIALLQDILRMQTVLMGLALPDDRVHAPNEKFHLPNFFNGIAASIHFLDELADHSIAESRGPVPPEVRNGGTS
jgi:acetylornithine deacetylase/succinyl-diaminopimelate desuccinylase-like protein